MEWKCGQDEQPGAERHGRERVLSAARELFLERGYTGVSMQEIADAAGMRKASLYYHVRDKEDLFVQVVQQEREHLSAGIAAELATATTLEDSLRRVARFFGRAVRSDMSRLMSDFMRHVAAAPKAEMRQSMNQLLDLLRDRFEQAAASGELRDVDPTLAASFFIGMLSGLIHQTKDEWLEMPFDDALADQLVDVLLYGIAAQGPASPQSGSPKG